jgi:hypothetical protein
MQSTIDGIQQRYQHNDSKEESDTIFKNKRMPSTTTTKNQMQSSKTKENANKNQQQNVRQQWDLHETKTALEC